MYSGFFIFRPNTMSMKFPIYTILLMLCLTGTAHAQQAVPKRYQAPLAGKADFSKLEDKYHANVLHLEAPAPDAASERAKLRQLKKEVANKYPHRRVATGQLKKTSVAPPAVTISYVADSIPGIPPDNDAAVSKGNISISVINTSVAVHNANTGQMIQFRKNLRLFSSAAGLPNGITVSRYDPKVLYDPDADRFICVLLHERDANNWIIVGFSATNDPGGIWNFYKFYGDENSDTTWFDYPSVAITPTEFFLTGNKIKYAESWQAGFKETVIYQIDKQSGYNGAATLSYNIWHNVAHNGRNLRNLYPVKSGSHIQGPEQYFLSNRNFDIQNDTVFLVKVTDSMGGNPSVTITPLISNLPYGLPPDGRQPDTNVKLATNDGRILGAFREGNEIQFVSTSVHPVSGSSAVYHGKIANYATTPALSANFIMVDTLDFGYPNLSYAGNNGSDKASIISFDYTGPNTYPGFAAVTYDGSQYSDLTIIKGGTNYILQLPDTVQRWGDYSGSQPDYNAYGSVWVAGIFGRHDKEYGNYIARLSTPFVNNVNTVSTPENKSVVYPNPASEIVKLEFELAAQEDVHFRIADVSGRVVDEILVQRCKPGRNKISFDIVTLSPGIYFLKGVNTQGKEVLTKRFVKQ